MNLTRSQKGLLLEIIAGVEDMWLELQTDQKKGKNVGKLTEKVDEIRSEIQELGSLPASGQVFSESTCKLIRIIFFMARAN